MDLHEIGGTRSYHREDDVGNATDGLGRGNGREVLREIQALDDHIQRGKDAVSTFRLFGLWIQNQGRSEKGFVTGRL